MRLLRPYIPVSVRLQVAASQCKLDYPVLTSGILNSKKSYSEKLNHLLYLLFGAYNIYHLDHDPALENRLKVIDENGIHTAYIPDANDPRYLIFRTAEDHKTKTLIRGDGALRSDVSQRRYLNKVAENRGLRKKKPSRKITNRKTKWPSRQFPKRKKQ
jgi:hypothetical protein